MMKSGTLDNVERLILENPSWTIQEVLSLYENKSNHFVCRAGLLKHLFKPYLDGVEIWSSWWSDYKRGTRLPFHKDMEENESFLFYVKSTGESPLVIGEQSYIVKTGDFIKFPSFMSHSIPEVNEDHRLALVITASDHIRNGNDYEMYN